MSSTMTLSFRIFPEGAPVPGTTSGVFQLAEGAPQALEAPLPPEMARAAGRVTRYGAPGGSSTMQSNYAITCAGLHQRRIRRRGTAMSATREDVTPDER
jgi:hypothetical protein